MKSVLATLLICFASFSILAEGVVVKTTVSLGKKSKNCEGFGICSAQVATENPTGTINGSFRLDEAGNVLLISLNASDIKTYEPVKMTCFSNKTSVEFEEEYDLPLSLRSALKATKPLKIPKGVYQLLMKNGEYLIEIPLMR